MIERIVILDFGSQYTQLIARRIREQKVFCEITSWDAPRSEVLVPGIKGIILSGGPLSIYSSEAPTLQDFIIESELPLLGICYGMQALAQKLGGEVQPAQAREYGLARLTVIKKSPLITDRNLTVWMSHGDRVEKQPEGFQILAKSDNSPVAAMGNLERRWYGIQFHPEVKHTINGQKIIKQFVMDICGCKPEWTPDSIIEQSVTQIKQMVGNGSVLSAVSGGVDSSVATSLVHKAVGDQMRAVFIDNGLLRMNERAEVERVFSPLLKNNLTVIDASQQFLEDLTGVIDPELKRKKIGERFIREFENAALNLGNPQYLVQGTIYPDVVESKAVGTTQTHRIKSHHNVAGLPEKMNFKLIEPLRYLFKDEVRAVGELLGLPRDLIWRQPFPGPGLAVRCLGEVTADRLETLRKADAIFTQELKSEDLLGVKDLADGTIQGTSQAFAILLPVRTVGVMGDQRSYQEVIALRAVTTTDFMTADWSRLSNELLSRVSNRIINEVPNVNRVVYDITSKPPATIEWE